MLLCAGWSWAEGASPASVPRELQAAEVQVTGRADPHLWPRSMLPDVVDDFQRQSQHHGPGLETIFYSSYVFFTKLSSACALGISTLSLESVPRLGKPRGTGARQGGKQRAEPPP